MTTTEIRVNSIDKPGFVNLAGACSRCGGSGIYSQYHGTCWRCGGNGRDPQGFRTYAYPASWTDEAINEHAAKRAERAAAARDRKVARDAAKAAAKLDAFLADNAEAVAVIRAGAERNSFLADLAEQLERRGELSACQIEAALDSARRDAEYDARKAEEAANAPAAEPLPVGKAIVIEGVVVSVKVQESQWGSQLKMLVKGNGWKVWSSVPAGSGRIDGERVRFVADVEQKDDDFGIAKRPRKLEIVEV